MMHRHNKSKMELSTFFRKKCRKEVFVLRLGISIKVFMGRVFLMVKGASTMYKRTGNALVLHTHDITVAVSFISSIQRHDICYLYEIAEDRNPSNAYEKS